MQIGRRDSVEKSTPVVVPVATGLCSIALPDCQAQCFRLLSARTMVPLRSGLLLWRRILTPVMPVATGLLFHFIRHRPCSLGIRSRSAYWYMFLLSIVRSYLTVGPWYSFSDSRVDTPVAVAEKTHSVLSLLWYCRCSPDF
jgi:hypothetical protein